MALDGATAPAEAQSFFQALFGGGAPAASPPVSRPVPSLRSFSRVSPYGGNVSRSVPDNGGAPAQSYGGGAYQTMCVRTCDGYYWPVNAGASRSRMQLEDRVCSQSCDTEAKLFYLPRGSSDIANMVDLSGRPYSRLPNAFGYRSSLIAGCSCRPMPWSTAEAERHDGYRVAETLERERHAAEEAEAAAVKAATEAAKAGSAVKSAQLQKTAPSGPPQAETAELPADPPMALELPPEMPSGATRSHDTPAIAAREQDRERASEMIVASAELPPSEIAEISGPVASNESTEAPDPAPPTAVEPAHDAAEASDAPAEVEAAPATTAPWQPAIATRTDLPEAATGTSPAPDSDPAALPEPAASEPDATSAAMTTGVLTDANGGAVQAADPPPDMSAAKKPALRAAGTAKPRSKSGKGKTAVASWLGKGGGAYTWPGDAPRRRGR